MYFLVATKMAVAFGTDGFTQAVSMEGANAVMIEATLFAKGGGSTTVTLQGCNDMENWGTTGLTSESMAFTALGYMDTVGSTIAYRYVRLKVSQATSGTGIIALGIDTAQL